MIRRLFSSQLRINMFSGVVTTVVNVVVIDGTDTSPEESAQNVILHLEKEGYIGPNN